MVIRVVEVVDIYHFHHFFYSFTTRYWLFWFVTRRWRPGMLARTRPNETAFLKRWNDVPTALERRSKAAGTFLLRLRNDYLRLSVVETLLVALITRRFVAELSEDMGKSPTPPVLDLPCRITGTANSWQESSLKSKVFSSKM